MYINILMGMPILVFILGFVFDDLFFFVNLIVVPVLVLALLRDKLEQTIVSLGIVLFLGWIYFIFSNDERRSLYFFFEILAIGVMCQYPSYFSLKITERQIKLFRYYSIGYIGLYFVFIFVPSFWFDGRYIGPVRNTNFSVYLLMFSIIFVLLEDYKNNFVSFGFNIFSFFIIFEAYVVSESRSVLFFLLIPLYLIYENIGKRASIFAKFYIVVLIFFVASVSAIIFIKSSDQLDRFDTEETSYLSRMYVTDILIEELVSSFGFPKGPRYTNDLVVQTTGNINMHAHNDILVGLIDYGLFFVFGLIIFVRVIINTYGKNVFVSLGILAYMSAALHGYLMGCTLLFCFLMVLKKHSLRNV